MTSSNIGYAHEAPNLLIRYEQLRHHEVHAAWLDWLPQAPSQIIDIGAGTGRDAGWFASQGHDVVAVEPTNELRLGGQALHPEPNIHWLDDRLPHLTKVRALDQDFDMALMNGVWMHLDEDERTIAMPHIAGLLRPSGRLILNLRHGPVPQGRRMFDVSGEETTALADKVGLRPLMCTTTASIQAGNIRRGVTWTNLVFEKS
ncbi:MAG: class I SAM-dependent methyltransferase [Pseudomonadota bacterium]